MWFKTKAKATLRENVLENKNGPIFVSYLATELLSSIQHPKSHKNWLNTCVEKTYRHIPAQLSRACAGDVIQATETASWWNAHSSTDVTSRYTLSIGGVF